MISQRWDLWAQPRGYGLAAFRNQPSRFIKQTAQIFKSIPVCYFNVAETVLIRVCYPFSVAWAEKTSIEQINALLWQKV